MASSSSEMASSAASDIMIENDPTLFDKIKFLVGSDKVVIEAPKGLLAASSPVFKAMLFGSMAEKSDTIKLEGDCPQAFRALVDFVHYKKLKVDDFEVALAVCLMAHRYIMLVLVESCLDYMDKNFNCNYLYGLDYYECLKLVGGDGSMMKNVMACCQRHAQDLFDSDRHLNVSIDTMIELFKGKKLNITSEIVLINALAQFKEAYDDPSLNEGILKALSYVRLFTLNPVDIIECPNLKKILSIFDVQMIVERLLQTEGNMPNISKSTESRNMFYSALKRLAIKQNYYYLNKLKGRIFYILNITINPNTYVRGVILGVPGDEVIPELDMILSIRCPSGALVKQERFFLKNLNKAGRQCIFEDKYGRLNTFILTMLVLNDVSISGTYTGEYVGTRYDCSSKISPIDALLKGFLVD